MCGLCYSYAFTVDVRCRGVVNDWKSCAMWILCPLLNRSGVDRVPLWLDDLFGARMDSELVELQRQFHVAWETKSSVRLSESNGVELVNTL